MSEKSKLIDIEGLKVFKTNYDIEVDAKIAGAGATVTKESIIAALEYTPADENDIPEVPAWAMETHKPSYTATEVGAIASTEKGSNNGVATLGSDGKIPSSQLPSYVDDVVEYDTKADFPTSGESGKIYIDKATNITYRWGGSEYVAIGSDLALGETSSTAYAGNKGKANADAISALQITVGALPTSYAPVNAQANVIETIKVNGTALTPSSKAVNITVPSAVTESTVAGWGFTKNTGNATFYYQSAQPSGAPVGTVWIS